MKNVQETLNNFVVVVNDDKNLYLYKSSSWESKSVYKAVSGKPIKTLKLDKTTALSAIDKLKSYGFIVNEGTSPALQVTYDGWYCQYMNRVELFNLIIKNVVIPIIVSFITTLIALKIEQSINPHG